MARVPPGLSMPLRRHNLCFSVAAICCILCCSTFTLVKSEQTIVVETINYPQAEEMFARMKNLSSSLPQWEKGEPVQVYIGFYVESLSNFRTTDMSFDMDMYFSMSWQDARLVHDFNEPYLITDSHIEGKVKLNWVPDNPIERNLDIKLPELRIVETESKMCTTVYTYAQTKSYKMTGNFSCLEGILGLEREIGYHLTQTYIPTVLIVVISWVSFFIDPSAVPARVSLSFTTLLTLSTMSTGVRVALPPVAYAKAIDVWMGACTGFVFVTLIQFALVNSFMRRSLHYSQLMKNSHLNERKVRELQHLVPQEMVGLMSDGYGDGFRQSDIAALLHKLADVNRQRAKKIDMACRFLFPTGFAVFNVFYWISYTLGD